MKLKSFQQFITEDEFVLDEKIESIIKEFSKIIGSDKNWKIEKSVRENEGKVHSWPLVSKHIDRFTLTVTVGDWEKDMGSINEVKNFSYELLETVPDLPSKPGDDSLKKHKQGTEELTTSNLQKILKETAKIVDSFAKT